MMPEITKQQKLMSAISHVTVTYVRSENNTEAILFDNLIFKSEPICNRRCYSQL